MTVTADQLAGLLHDALTAQFPQAGTAGDGTAGTISMLFATMGRPVDRAGLRPPEGTPPASALAWVQQMVSGLVDPVPGPGESYLQGSRHLSREYDALVRSASPLRDGDPDAVAVVAGRIARAVRLLDVAAVVPIAGPPVPYLPTGASPLDWYDPDGPHWTRLSLSEGDPAPAGTVPPVVRPHWDWLVAPEAAATWLDLTPTEVTVAEIDPPELTVPVAVDPPDRPGPDPEILDRIRLRPEVDLARLVTQPAGDESRFTRLLAQELVADGPELVAPADAQPDQAAHLDHAAQLDEAAEVVRADHAVRLGRTAHLDRTALRDQLVRADHAVQLDQAVQLDRAVQLEEAVRVQDVAVRPLGFAGTSSDLLERADRVRVARVPEAVAARPSLRERGITAVIAARPALLPVLVQESTPAPATGSGFSLELDYCWVTLDRVWLDQVLLSTPGWQVAGAAPGSYSAGDLDTPGQAVPAVPLGFAVVKDVTITANWSSADATARSAAAGLGPFLLAGSQFAAGSGTLRIPGMQIIAWMCEVPPVLPPG